MCSARVSLLSRHVSRHAKFGITYDICQAHPRSIRSCVLDNTSQSFNLDGFAPSDFPRYVSGHLRRCSPEEPTRKNFMLTLIWQAARCCQFNPVRDDRLRWPRSRDTLVVVDDHLWLRSQIICILFWNTLLVCVPRESFRITAEYTSSSLLSIICRL